MRKYSIDEIDRFRVILRGRMYFDLDKQADEATIEARIRTYMAASVDPKDLKKTLVDAAIKSYDLQKAEMINSALPMPLKQKIWDSTNRRFEDKLREYEIQYYLILQRRVDELCSS